MLTLKSIVLQYLSKFQIAYARFFTLRMRRERRIHFFLAIIISFIIPVTLGFIHYSDLTEVDAFCSGLSFETPDQENLQAGDKEGLRVFGLDVCSNTLLLARNLLKEGSHSLSSTPSFLQEALVLRC